MAILDDGMVVAIQAGMKNQGVFVLPGHSFLRENPGTRAGRAQRYYEAGKKL